MKALLVIWYRHVCRQPWRISLFASPIALSACTSEMSPNQARLLSVQVGAILHRVIWPRNVISSCWALRRLQKRWACKMRRKFAAYWAAFELLKFSQKLHAGTWGLVPYHVVEVHQHQLYLSHMPASLAWVCKPFKLFLLSWHLVHQVVISVDTKSTHHTTWRTVLHEFMLSKAWDKFQVCQKQSTTNQCVSFAQNLSSVSCGCASWSAYRVERLPTHRFVNLGCKTARRNKSLNYRRWWTFGPECAAQHHLSSHVKERPQKVTKVKSNNYFAATRCFCFRKRSNILAKVGMSWTCHTDTIMNQVIPQHITYPECMHLWSIVCTPLSWFRMSSVAKACMCSWATQR